MSHRSKRNGSKTRAAAWIVAAAVATAAGGSPAAAYTKKTVGTFSDAVDIVAAPGFATHLYVVEQSGAIRLMVGTTKQAKPFLNLTALVSFSGEQGLLSAAFPPDHATSRRFYVQFVNKAGDIEIDEYKRSTTAPLTADPASRRRLLVVPHRDAGNHNGGRLQFDPAGRLYVSIGDGGATPHYAPDRSKLLGKILRITPLATGGKPYGIPADNPFVGQAGKRGEIWAFGLRNPWRWTLADGMVAIGDVGQRRWEEVNFVSLAGSKGVDFGWPHWEGRTVYDASVAAPAPVRHPAFVYSHDGGRCAVVGGLVVGAPDLPRLKGRYLYGDLCTGEIRSFIPDAAKNAATGDAAVGISAPGLRSFGRDTSGRVHLTDGSTLWRLAP